MSKTPILIRHAERPSVTFPGGADYCPVIGDDNGAGVSVRTGIQTSPRATRPGRIRTPISRS